MSNMSSNSNAERRRPTLHDVAADAEVSIQTVSNVLRGRFDLMRPETRERVEKSMASVGYHPNVAARGLRSARTNTFGFLVLDEAPRFLADPLTDLLIEGRVDGAFVLLSGDPALRRGYIEQLKAFGLPFVVFDEVIEDPDVLVVRTDERVTARELTEHLIARGHEGIAFVAARLPWAVVEQRHLGYRDAPRTPGDGDLRRDVAGLRRRGDGGASVVGGLASDGDHLRQRCAGDRRHPRSEGSRPTSARGHRRGRLRRLRVLSLR
jgi:DNA-binding LacI/PurR family transcriptional regulator